MLVSRKELASILSALYPFKGGGKENPANIYMFVKDEQGKSYAVATDNTIAAIYPLSFELGQPFRVSGDIFAQSVKRLVNAHDLDLTIKDNELVMKSDIGTETAFLIPERVNTMFDYVSEVPEELFEAVPSNFNTLLDKLCMFTSSESDKVILQNLYADKNKMCAASSSEIVLARLDGEIKKLFILGSHAQKMRKYKITHYVHHDEYNFFKTDTGMIIIEQSLSLQERFPVVITPEDYSEDEMRNGCLAYTPRELFNTNGMMEVSMTDDIREAFKNMVQSCKYFADENESPWVFCSCENGFLTVAGAGNTGRHKEGVSAPGTPDFKFEVNPYLLIDILDRKLSLFIGNGKAITKDDSIAHLVLLN